MRQDLPVVHQIIQSNHATQQMFSIYHLDSLNIPNIVLVGVPDVKALERVTKKLEQGQIPHYRYIEPDGNMGFTAITTAPISGEQREVLRNYRVYSPVAQQQERLSLQQEMQVQFLPGEPCRGSSNGAPSAMTSESA